MPLDGSFRGEEPLGPWCTSCKTPIAAGQKSVRVSFAHDPHGFGGLTGEYHEACSKPFVSMANALDMLSFRRF
jgi:hypothetical protein